MTLQLHADLYPLDAIDRAVSSFAGVARFEIEPGAPYHRVIGGSGATETVMRELANHVLASAILGGPPSGSGQ